MRSTDAGGGRAVEPPGILRGEDGPAGGEVERVGVVQVTVVGERHCNHQQSVRMRLRIRLETASSM